MHLSGDGCEVKESGVLKAHFFVVDIEEFLVALVILFPASPDEARFLDKFLFAVLRLLEAYRVMKVHVEQLLSKLGEFFITNARRSLLWVAPCEREVQV